MPPPEALYYSIKEAAPLIGVHPYTLREWCRLGKFKADRVGKRGRFRIRKNHPIFQGQPQVAAVTGVTQ